MLLADSRRQARIDSDGELVTLSACDPLNLVGSIVPGERIPSQRGRSVRLLDGALAPILDAEDLTEAVAALDLQLSAEEARQLEEHYTPHGPSWF